MVVAKTLSLGLLFEGAPTLNHEAVSPFAVLCYLSSNIFYRLREGALDIPFAVILSCKRRLELHVQCRI